MRKAVSEMFRDYESLQTLARNFAGRSFDLNNSADRHAMNQHAEFAASGGVEGAGRSRVRVSPSVWQTLAG